MVSRQNLKTLPGKPYPMGVSFEPDGKVNFAASLHSREECGVLLYLRNHGTPVRLPFRTGKRIGNIYCLRVEGLEGADFKYNFYAGDEVITDPYAGIIHGNGRWGKKVSPPLKGGVEREDYDWEEDAPLMTPLSETVLYLIHPRGFTRHASSGVPHKGTFMGIVEKIPYLKELGITAVELMPSYEFTELEKPPKAEAGMEAALSHYMDPPEDAAPRINFWGYKRGYYFAPKMSLSATGCPGREFRDMVKALHGAGIEVVMQFYFPVEVKQAYILEVVRHWVLEYHVDGFHLMGTQVPMALLATEPILGNVKLFYQDIPCREIFDGAQPPVYKNLAAYNDGFLYAVRRFLKSDEDSLMPALESLKRCGEQAGVINYITNYCGFTLADLVSYDRKHNEENGEGGSDGETYNMSWNCGCEGKTRRKGILALRRKQMKNAILLLLTAQGTPMILGGDEFGFSRRGNNNPYCQDNEVSWLDWRLTERNADFHAFVKEAIAFRKRHPILHQEREFTMLDYMGCGYPDLSYHGEDAWRLAADRLSRHAGVMYCGRYAKKDREEDDSFLYLAYNMHWEAHEFALPALPAGMRWQEVCSTDAGAGTEWQKDTAAGQTGPGDGPEKDERRKYPVGGRTVCILEGISFKKDFKKAGRGRKNRGRGRKTE